MIEEIAKVKIGEIIYPISVLEEITYSNLKSLRDASGLTTGGFYHIIDYVTTTKQANTTSASFAFDILVQALDANTLNETAYAIKHNGDTHFTSCDLSAWELKYSLDNNESKYAWAVTGSTGRGVIYYMKDEFGNEAPYDFKNIKFNNKFTFGGASDESLNGVSHDNIVSYLDGTNLPFITFGANCYGNKIEGIDCHHISIDNSYVRYCTVKDGVEYINISGYTTSASSYLQNIVVLGGIKGTSTQTLNITGLTVGTEQPIFYNLNLVAHSTVNSDGTTQLVDENTGDNVYPMTKAEAVFFDNDTDNTLTDKLSEISTKEKQNTRGYGENISGNRILKSLLVDTYLENGFYNANGEFRTNSYMGVYKFSVEAGKVYEVSSLIDSGYTGSVPFIFWIDSHGTIIRYDIPFSEINDGNVHKNTVVAPKDAVQMWMNIIIYRSINFYCAEISTDSKEQKYLQYVEDSEVLTITSLLANKFVTVGGSILDDTRHDVIIFDVQGGKDYLLCGYDDSIDYVNVIWMNKLGKRISYYHPQIYGQVFNNLKLTAPLGAEKAYLNVIHDITAILKEITLKEIESTESLKHKLTCSEGFPLEPFEILAGKWYNNKTIRDLAAMSIKKFKVTEKAWYEFKGEVSSGYSFNSVFWFNANHDLIFTNLKFDYSYDNTRKIDEILQAPNGATEVWINTLNALSSKFEVKAISKVEVGTKDLNPIESIEILLSPISVNDNHFVKNSSDELGESSLMAIWQYNVEQGKFYNFTSQIPGGYGTFYTINWIDSSDHVIKREYDYDTSYIGSQSGIVIAPEGAVQMWMNIIKSKSDSFTFNALENKIIDLQELKRQIENIGEDKLMKIKLNSNGSFYVRTKYNDTKDIIVNHYINNNKIISFFNTFVGNKELSDAELMVDAYNVSTHSDSTAPFMGCSEYWHLFGQHGYLIPTISNSSVGMTSNDIGAKWKDQNNNEYIIGKVTSSTIYLLPVIYTSGGHDVRGWTNPWQSITSLIHVSGGSYTTQITVSSSAHLQIRPIMSVSNREFYIDGKKISEAGQYYCDEFKVSESAVGYDPATIDDWFGGPNGCPDLTNAEIMAQFTFSYNYKGAQCCVNTSVDIRRELRCQSYGAIQQQFFFDQGDYKAMFLIPKAKDQNGVTLDKPFNSPSNSSPTYDFKRTSTYLKDVDDIIDRQIGYLYNPNTGKYLVGMAAGLSLVTGDTVKEKRNQNIPVGDSNDYYRVLTFSPSNTNKFYIAAFNAAPYESNDYYLPNTLFKEVNYYVSYFDPAENKGQVYWYKDGNNYIIYAHCQSVENKLAIKVPSFMESLNLSIIEKTTNAELLTTTIQNGKFFVNYNTNDANYIVLKAS